MKAKIISIFILFLMYGHAYSTQRDTTNWECKSLNARQIANFTAISNCYGYIRYFYPNTNLKKFDWVRFLMYAVNKVENIETDKELKVTLNELFLPLCPSIMFSDDTLKSIPKIKPPFYAIKHEGIGKYSDIFNEKGYSPISLFTDKYDYDSLYCYRINDKLFVSFPIAVHNLPTKTKSFNQFTKLVNKVDEAGINTLTFVFKRKKILTSKLLFHLFDYRIADLIIRHNFIQHFYGYYNEDNLANKWENQFRIFLNTAAQTDSPYRYYDNLCNYSAIVRDQHLVVWPTFNIGPWWLAMYLPMSYPDISYDFVQDTCYIKKVGDKYKDKITEGDIIISVNNQLMKDLIQQKLQDNSHSTKESGLQQLASTGKLLATKKYDSTTKSKFLQTNNRDTIIKLTLINKSNQLYEVDLKTNLSEIPIVNKSFYKKLKDDLYYVNLCSDTCTYKNFEKHINTLQSAKGIIFDLRGYPQNDVITILSHFIDEPIETGNLVTPIYCFPNHKNIDYKPVEKWSIEPANSPNSKNKSKKYEYKTPLSIRIDVPIVFLINAKSLSFGETIVDMIKYYKIGKLVGTPTAGCNGDITRIDIPNCNFYLTYNKFYSRDGSQHHCIGIQPDYFCEMKISDIRNNIDTQLEFAKKIILNNGTANNK